MPQPANDDAPSRLDVGDDDLRRYVTGDLSPERRRAVEGFLACNPDMAAGVMTLLHQGGRPPRRHRGRRLVAGALAVMVAASGASAFAGWTAAEHRDMEGWREADGDMPPVYVEEAAESRQAGLVRAAMASQVESPRLDVAEIRRNLRLDVPSLPDDWRVIDVQVYPTDAGPSINLSVETPAGQRLNLFVVRADTDAASGTPELAARNGEIAAFWERGESAYVLSGDASGDTLLSLAKALANAKNL